MLTALVACIALDAAVSDVVRLPRPAEGEWTGVYILGHKTGYSFSQTKSLSGPHKEPLLLVIEDETIHATVGQNAVSRRLRDEKTYEAKPHGRLLSLHSIHEGDGGDLTLDVTFDDQGTHVTRTPKDGTPEKLELPPTKDTVESADLPRLAMKRKKKVEGEVFNTFFLKDRHDVADYQGLGELVAGGTRAKVAKIALTEDDEKIAATFAIDPKTGKVLEFRFGGSLLGVPEPEEVAKKLDTVDFFALTMVQVDKKLPLGEVPATVVYDVAGIPDAMRPESNRQTYEKLPDGQVELTVHAVGPTHTAQIPETEPRAELQPTPAIESGDPAIAALAKQIVGDEKDAFAATQKLSQWVYANVKPAYGRSSDRATDVLKQKVGDCTEHSLLLAALARSVGIPAELVFGLVYALGPNGQPGLLWHEWVQVYVGEWTAVDPTFGQATADATHIQLGHDILQDAMGLMGQLRIHVAQIDTGPAKVPGLETGARDAK